MNEAKCALALSRILICCSKARAAWLDGMKTANESAALMLDEIAEIQKIAQNVILEKQPEESD